MPKPFAFQIHLVFALRRRRTRRRRRVAAFLLRAITAVVTITNHQRHVFNAQATDTAVAEGLEAAGLQVRQFATLLLREPGDVRVDMGRWCGHFGTLTPFDRRALLPLLLALS